MTFNIGSDTVMPLDQPDGDMNVKLSILTTATLAVAAAALIHVESATAQDTKTVTEWDIQTQPASAKIIQDALGRFEKANPGYKADRAQIPNDAYKTKLKIAFGANEPPCVFTNWGGGGLLEYVKAGQVVDLTPYLAKDAAFKDRFVSAAFDATTFQGKTFGLPGENTSAAVVYYNTEMFTQLGLTTPKTWPELLKVVETLKAKGIAPLALANKAKWPGSMYFMYLVDRIGGPDVFRKAATRAPGGSFADPAFIEAGQSCRSWSRPGPSRRASTAWTTTSVHRGA